MNAFGTRRIELNKLIHSPRELLFFSLIEDMIAVTTIEKIEAMKKARFFFLPFHCSRIWVDSEACNRPRIAAFTRVNRTPITLLILTSHYFPTPSLLTHHHFSQTSGERRKLRGPSRKRHSYVKLRGGREIRDQSGRRWPAEQLGRSEEKLVRWPTIQA